MTTINETVEQAMSSAGYQQYAGYAQPVVTALVNREQQIVGRLIEFAERSDLNVDAVRSTLSDVGMHMPTTPSNIMAATDPGPTMTTPAQAEAADAPDVGDTLRRIEETLTGLVGFARENGYRG